MYRYMKGSVQSTELGYTLCEQYSVLYGMHHRTQVYICAYTPTCDLIIQHCPCVIVYALIWLCK